MDNIEVLNREPEINELVSIDASLFKMIYLKKDEKIGLKVGNINFENLDLPEFINVRYIDKYICEEPISKIKFKIFTQKDFDFYNLSIENIRNFLECLDDITILYVKDVKNFHEVFFKPITICVDKTNMVNNFIKMEQVSKLNLEGEIEQTYEELYGIRKM